LDVTIYDIKSYWRLKKFAALKKNSGKSSVLHFLMLYTLNKKFDKLKRILRIKGIRLHLFELQWAIRNVGNKSGGKIE
jgi:hypothetical protein